MTNADFNSKLGTIQAVRILDDLYESYVPSLFELAKVFTRPVTHLYFSMRLDQDLIGYQLELEAKQKWTGNIDSKTIVEPSLKFGDLAEVYIWNDKNKRGKWLSLKVILEIERQSGTFTILASSRPYLEVCVWRCSRRSFRKFTWENRARKYRHHFGNIF